MRREFQFYVYIVTNWKKTTFYTGMTNNLMIRLKEHYDKGIERYEKEKLQLRSKENIKKASSILNLLFFNLHHIRPSSTFFSL